METINLPTTEIRLWGWAPWDDKINQWGEIEQHGAKMQVRAALFGQMVKRAMVVNQGYYEGDLFYDALWIERNVNGPTKFYFIAREMGSNIGDDDDLMQIVWNVSGSGTSQYYEVELFDKDNRGDWWVRFTNHTPALSR